MFLRVGAPHCGLTSSGVGCIVRRAMERAGIDHEGLPAAHLSRHSRATNLLRGGASLEAIGALLRHKTPRSTALYARVDVPMLLEIVGHAAHQERCCLQVPVRALCILVAQTGGRGEWLLLRAVFKLHDLAAAQAQSDVHLSYLAEHRDVLH